jgi:hypothetical protein
VQRPCRNIRDAQNAGEPRKLLTMHVKRRCVN